MPRKTTRKGGRKTGRKATRTTGTRAGARLAGGTAGSPVSAGAVLARHVAFRGKEVDFENGRLVIKSADLKRKMAQALGETPGSHSALIRVSRAKPGTKQGTSDVILDARC